ncbi:MAG TPA: cytochrome c oxidase assembly protein [Candidatus Limnocylindria bacterium]|nr:cytochrome c oxidase assembly protein [Candidatus Limnocylindria bacterium]
MRRLLPPLLIGFLLLLPSRVLAHGAEAPTPTFPSVLLEWRFDPTAIVPLVLVAALYLWAVRRVDAAHPGNRHPAHRTWLFMGGLVAIAVALTSPIEAYEGLLFSVHMIQHMLLELVAAPLLLAGAPITLALRVSSPPVRRRLLSVLQSRVVHVISFPVIAWVLFAAVNWGWHFSTLYDQALENELLHYVQHATFLGAALLFWWPAIGADPSPWRLPHPMRLFYLFLAMPQNSFLGVALLQTSTVLYPHYVTNGRTWGPSPLEDQHLGGVLMWVMGDMAFLAGMAVVVWLWVRHEERRTSRLDARLAADRAARGEEAWRPSSRP